MDFCFCCVIVFDFVGILVIGDKIYLYQLGSVRVVVFVEEDNFNVVLNYFIQVILVVLVLWFLVVSFLVILEVVL